LDKNQDPGPGINVPDPQHCVKITKILEMKIRVLDPDQDSLGSALFLEAGSGSELIGIRVKSWIQIRIRI
jgi:hypothetical protein